MVDDSISPSGPQNHKGDNSGDKKSADKSTDYAGGDPGSEDGNRAGKKGLSIFIRDLVFAGVVGTGIWVFGEHLSNHGHTMWGSWVNFLACVVFLAVVPIAALRHWNRPILVGVTFLLFIGILAAIWIASSSDAKSTPHLTLLLTSSESPGSELSLSSNFLMFPSGKTLILDAVNGYVEIPLQRAHSNVVVNFDLFNDSRVDIQDAELIAHFDSTLTIEPDKDWKRVSPKQPYSGLESFGYHLTHAILPDDGSVVPGFTIIPDEFDLDHRQYLCFVQLQGKGDSNGNHGILANFPKRGLSPTAPYSDPLRKDQNE